MFDTFRQLGSGHSGHWTLGHLDLQDAESRKQLVFLVMSHPAEIIYQPGAKPQSHTSRQETGDRGQETGSWKLHFCCRCCSCFSCRFHSVIKNPCQVCARTLPHSHSHILFTTTQDNNLYTCIMNFIVDFCGSFDEAVEGI